MKTRAIGLWFIGLAVMIFIMAVVGAVTRLTESGLSITEWKPVTGILPPLSPAAWQEAYTKYQEIPEARTVHAGLTLDEFKNIFWWEYLHRLWGRLIGLYALAGGLFFGLWHRRRTPAWLRPHFLILLLLGGVQGYIGWWMVKSGLSERTDVSQYRLVTHLLMAMLLYCYALGLGFKLVFRPVAITARLAQFRMAARGLVLLILLTTTMGGFTAGMNAGLMYNTWPDMDGAMMPSGLFAASPWWINFFENATMIQFAHRTLAHIAGVAVMVFAILLLRTRPPKPLKVAVIHMLTMMLVQISLGIHTLLFGVPVALAAAHQAGAFMLVAFTGWTLFYLENKRKR